MLIAEASFLIEIQLIGMRSRLLKTATILNLQSHSVVTEIMGLKLPFFPSAICLLPSAFFTCDNSLTSDNSDMGRHLSQNLPGNLGDKTR